MLELEYIPLKTPDGAICGHARVRGGFVELTLRTPMRASALVITENGSADGAIGARIPVSAQVSAIALHDKDVMRCCGFSRTTALQPSDLRRRLQAMVPARPRAAEAITPAAKAPAPPPAERAPAAFVEEIAAGIPSFTPAAKPAGKAPPRAMPDAASRDLMEARATRVYKHIDDAAIPAPPPKAPKSPRPQSAKASAQPRPAPKTPKAPRPAAKPPWPPPPPPPDPDTPRPGHNGHMPPEPTPPQPGPHPGGHTPPPPEPNPPQPGPHPGGHTPPPPEPTPPQPGPHPGGHTPPAPEPPHHHADDGPEPGLHAAGWARDADITPPDATPAPVPNPFPHIFPDAQFVRASGGGALFGEWVHGNACAEISAVPGPYSPQPPPNLVGYTRYIRARSGGYWVKVIER